MFEDLKNKLSSAPILKFLDFTKLFEAHIDANDFAINGVLMQDGHSIPLTSRSSMGFDYNGQLMGKSCMPLCVA